MLLTELDGFVAGIVVCPELVMPGEWLPQVWGGEGGAPFADVADAQQFASMVIAYYNEVARNLAHARYHPIFDVDERHGEVLWELWIEGFALAMTLRPESWLAIGEREDEEAAAALSGMLTLIGIARDESDAPRELIDRVTDEAHDLIPGWVASLHDRRMAHAGVAGVQAERPAKIGRNDPCTCGSGRKYKKCCGLN